MKFYEDHPELNVAIETVQAAALGGAAWTDALAAVASVTQSTGGQLIGFDGEGGVAFNWLTGVDPDCLIQFDAVGGNDGRVNSRLPIGRSAPELVMLDERAFTTEADRADNPAYSDCLERWNITHICLTNLVKEQDFGVGFAVNRSPQEGGMSVRQQREFSILSHHMRHAVRVQRMLENQSARIVSGLLEQMETIGFVCFRDGRVGAMSPKAEQLLFDGDRLRLRHGALSPTHGGAAALGAAIQQTFNGLVGAPVIVRDAEGARPLVIEVVPLPFEQHMSAFEDAVLVIVRDPGPMERKRLASATMMFGYTPTEARVAAGLLAGRSPLKVAGDMRVEIATVRSHIRRLYEKSGVSTQLELTSLLGSLP